MFLKKELKTLAKPYYWVNVFLGFSYLIGKKMPFLCNYLFKPMEETCELESREVEILFFLVIVVMIRTRKIGSLTMINYLTSSFIYAKIANLILWAYSDFRYGIGFLFLFVLTGLLFPEPSYKGPEHVTYFRSFNVLLDELERDKRVNWIICFYTVWSPACVNFASIFSQLSAEYDTDVLKFGKIDVGRFPEAAKEFRISDNTYSRQLPTVILFQNGRETNRRPIVDSKGKLEKFFFSADNLRAAFGLNNIYKQCLKNSSNDKLLTSKAKKSN